MELASANRFALPAVRAILDASRSVELSVADKAVSVTAARGGPRGWQAAPGISEEQDGPWPADVSFSKVFDDEVQAVMDRLSFPKDD